MKMKKQPTVVEAYEAPKIEVIEVMVESGFQTSVSGGAFGDDGVVITPPIE